MCKKVLFVCFLLSAVLLKAQFERDYKPIEIAPIPKSFTELNQIELLEKSVKSNTILTAEEADYYFRRFAFYKTELLKSGQLYLDTVITKYLDGIKNKLLVNNPELKANIQLYLTRYTSVNAFCFLDGSIFVNVALIGELASEEELAFILAHEIGHYAEQHSVKDFKRLKTIQDQETNYSNYYSDNFRSLKFSRESEFDADAWGLQLMASAGYDVTHAAKALEKINHKEDTIATIEFKKIFSNNLFILDTSKCNYEAAMKYKKLVFKNNIDPIRTGRLDDLFQTHPNTEKRIDAVNLMVKTMKHKNVAIKVGNDFEKIKRMSQFELVENEFRFQDYLNTFIKAKALQKEYPKNEYLETMVLKSLYWLSYYKELNIDGDILLNARPDGQEYDFYTFLALVNTLPLKDLKKMAFAYSYDKSEKNVESESILFYTALITDNYLGKSASKSYYQDYDTKFPNGTFKRFVKTKLQ